MTQLTVPNPQDLQGQMLYDARGEGIGVIEGVYLDNETRAPEWAATRIGPSSLALVPLAEAQPTSGGVRVDYPRDQVLKAPLHLNGLDNEVTEDTENRLYAYYAGRSGGSNGSSGGSNGNGTAAVAKEEAAEIASTAKEQAAKVAATAKDQAAEVAETAKEEAVAVAEVAKEEAAEVVHVAADEARDLVETTASELESQAEAQLAQLAEALHRTAGQALALARGNVDQAGPLRDLVGRAGHELQSVAVGIDERGSQGLLEDAQRVVRQRPRAAIFGTALAVVAGAKLMGTPAGERVKERLAPLREQAVEAGRNVADELKPLAQQRAEKAKETVASAAGRVKREAKGTAEDVKGTAKRSARTVKATARQSGSAVKQNTKRAARTSTRVG